MRRPHPRRASRRSCSSSFLLHKSTKRNDEVDESVFLDLGRQLALIHQHRSDGLVGPHAQPGDLFLNLLLDGSVYAIATLDFDDIHGLRRLNEEIDLQPGARGGLPSRIWRRRNNELATETDFPAKRSTNVDLPIRRRPETTTNEGDSFAQTDESNSN